MTAANPPLLFASYHAYLDHSSGAALATRDLFEALAAAGWDCRVVCGPQLDFGDGRGVPDVLREYGLPHHIERCAPPRGTRYELFHYTLNGVPVTQYRPAGYDPRRPLTQEEGIPFLDVLARDKKLAAYEGMVRHLLAPIRAAHPDGACLVISPLAMVDYTRKQLPLDPILLLDHMHTPPHRGRRMQPLHFRQAAGTLLDGRTQMRVGDLVVHQTHMVRHHEILRRQAHRALAERETKPPTP